MLPYIELHTHTYYSLLDGTDSPADLVQRGAELGLQGMALTDHNAVYGVIPFMEAAKKQHMLPIVGSEMTLEDGSHLTLLVENEQGWKNLCYLITHSRHNAPKGKGILPLKDLKNHTQGLTALSGCRRGEIRRAVREKRYNDALAAARRYLTWFGQDHFWIELQKHQLHGERTILRNLVTLATYLKIGYVATNNVHYALPEKRPLQDILVSIRHNKSIDEVQKLRRAGAEYYLKSPHEMERLFEDFPQAVTNTLTIAERCHFDLQFGLQDLPKLATPTGQSPERHLRYLCESALVESRQLDQAAAKKLLGHELGVIERAGLANYFLIVADIVRFARDNAIRCQGRGSAANSLTAYLLGISPVDPLAHNLVFERFLSEERVSVPDIDIDFQANRREEVIQYTYKKYGAAHTAMACTFVTYRMRSAIRDIGKALGIPPAVLEDAALATDRGDSIPKTSSYTEQLASLCDQIEGLPHHLSIHNGGMIITGSPLSHRLPTEPATMESRVVVQWDKTMLETAGIVKIDLLGLRMLSAIQDALVAIEHKTGQRPDFSSQNYDDPALFEMMTKGDTVGVFQVESRAQAQTLPRLKPTTFNDIIVSISLIRPGPVQGNMVHPYLRRRSGVESVSYAHPNLEAALEETLGVILFQEQVLKVARDLGGFTAGQGELLRRALGGKRPAKEIEKLRETFLQGATANDIPPEIAEQVFEGLKAFGGYSFPKSHAAAFAVLVWQSAWLKQYWPAQLAAALLSNQPMGFWTPAVIVNDARRHGIGVKKLDINRSLASCSTEDNDIRIGFGYISGIGEVSSKTIERARQAGAFRDLEDFSRRAKLPKTVIENLILVGAFDEWEADRRKLVWELGKMWKRENKLGLVFPASQVRLKPVSEVELLILEMQVMGLTTGKHIMSFYQDWMRKKHILSSDELSGVQDGNYVQIAGEMVMHQAPPTAKGHHFITLMDQDWNMLNVIVRPSVYHDNRYVLRHAPLLWIRGKLQREGNITNILCDRADVLPRIKH